MRFLFLFLLCCAGCMVGPTYHPPEMKLPESFSELRTESPSSRDLSAWWKQFNDPLLNQMMLEACSNNFDVRIAMEKILQARAQYRGQSAQLFPEVDLTAAATRSRISQDFFSFGSATPSLENFFQIGFDAIWELDFFGKFRHSKKGAYDLWEASEADAQDMLLSVLSEVARNYVNIRALQQQIEITSEKIAADKRELVLTQELLNAGLASDITVSTLIATLAGDESLLPPLESALKQTIYTLAILLGKSPEGFVAEFTGKGEIPVGLDRVPVGLPSDLLQRRPDIKRAERQLAAATEQVGVAVADLFPHISLTGSNVAGNLMVGSGYGVESSSLKTLFNPPSKMWSIGPAIRWDLLDFGRVQSNIDLNTSLQREALLLYEQTVITALQDVEGALVAYFEEQQKMKFLHHAVMATRRTLQLTQALYEAGLESEIQVLEAQKGVYNAVSTYLTSVQAVTCDLIALYKALGGDWKCSYLP